jgi:hypothetical protein
MSSKASSNVLWRIPRRGSPQNIGHLLAWKRPKLMPPLIAHSAPLQQPPDNFLIAFEIEVNVILIDFLWMG